MPAIILRHIGCPLFPNKIQFFYAGVKNRNTWATYLYLRQNKLPLEKKKSYAISSTSKEPTIQHRDFFILIIQHRDFFILIIQFRDLFILIIQFRDFFIFITRGLSRPMGKELLFFTTNDYISLLICKNLCIFFRVISIFNVLNFPFILCQTCYITYMAHVTLFNA